MMICEPAGYGVSENPAIPIPGTACAGNVGYGRMGGGFCVGGAGGGTGIGRMGHTGMYFDPCFIEITIDHTPDPGIMNRRILRACTLLLMAVTSGASLLRAQGPAASVDGSSVSELRLGISGGLTRNVHEGIMTPLEDPSCPPFAEKGPTWGFSAGLTATYRYSGRTGITAHLLYSTRPGFGRVTLPDAPVLIPGPNGDPVVIDQSMSATTEIRYDLYELGLLWNVDLLRTEQVGFGVALGGAIAHVDVFTQTIEQQLLAPENARFTNPENLPTRDSGRVMIQLKDSPVVAASPTRLSARGGAYLDLTLLGPLCVTPGVYYDHGLTSAVSNGEWYVHSVLFQLDVTVRL